MPMSRSRQHEHRRLEALGQVERRHRQRRSTPPGSPGRARCAWCRRATRRRSDQDVALLRARRHAGRRARALHVEDDRRDLGVVREADELAHQRDAGARRRRERARAVPRRADHHADRRQLVFRLQDAVVVLAGLRVACGSCSQNSLNASITDVDGVIGYHAATVAPAYTQPSAVAVLPSIRMRVVGRVHLLELERQRACEVLPSRSRSPSAIAVWFESSSAFFLRELLVEQLVDDVHVDVEQRRQRARRRRCSSSGSARATP